MVFRLYLASTLWLPSPDTALLTNEPEVCDQVPASLEDQCVITQPMDAVVRSVIGLWDEEGFYARVEPGSGLRLSMVRRGSMLRVVGLQRGDSITHIDGISVLNTHALAKRQFLPGSSVTVTVYRRDHELTVDFPLAECPQEEPRRYCGGR